MTCAVSRLSCLQRQADVLPHWQAFLHTRATLTFLPRAPAFLPHGRGLLLTLHQEVGLECWLLFSRDNGQEPRVIGVGPPAQHPAERVPSQALSPCKAEGSRVHKEQGSQILCGMPSFHTEHPLYASQAVSTDGEGIGAQDKSFWGKVRAGSKVKGVKEAPEGQGIPRLGRVEIATCSSQEDCAHCSARGMRDETSEETKGGILQGWVSVTCMV